MSGHQKTYGATRRGGRFLAATVENDGTRRQVLKLVDAPEHLGNPAEMEGRLFFGVDERTAVTKKIVIKRAALLEASQLAQFETEQALLEPPENYYFDCLPIDERNGRRSFISIAYYKREIDEAVEAYAALLRPPSGFKLNAVALAAGYLDFCRVEPGDLQILADLDSDGVVMAILHRRQLRSIGRLPLELNGSLTLAEARKAATEIKLSVSYHLAELFREGITIPASAVIISGHLAHDALIEQALTERFSTRVSRPRFNEGYFHPELEKNGAVRLEQFLIPLGLAAT